MKISPVSFGSIMVANLNNKVGPKHIPIEDKVRLAFPDEYGRGGNPAFRNYRLSELRTFGDEDFTIYNATKKFGEKLNQKYKAELTRNPHRVIITKAPFQINPQGDKVEKVFLTAVNAEEEAKIHKILCKSKDILAAMW